MTSPLIGILGGGQLGRMLALAGYPLGFRFRVFDPSPDAVAGHLADHFTGHFEDLEALDRFADGTDFLTLEWENVPLTAARHLEQRFCLRPSSRALEISQDRFREKTLFQQLGIPTPPFVRVDSQSELGAAVQSLGLPAVLKRRRSGYDGKGQRLVRTPAEASAAWEELGPADLILEGFIHFERELSVLAVRGASGEVRVYPLVENHHGGGILHHSVAPAPRVSPALESLAQEHVRKILDALDYRGVLALELFQVGDRLLASEIAPRVHNSGHWTTEGAETSQFENHLRAVTGLPLGSTAPVGYSVMLNVLGEEPETAGVLAVPGVHLHRYAKEPRPGRKLGHITVCGSTPAMVRERLHALAGAVNEETFEGVLDRLWADR